MFPTRCRAPVVAIFICCVAAVSGFAQNEPVIHWINDSGQAADTLLNGTGTFTTSFRTSNDVVVTQLAGATTGGFEIDSFAVPNPGSNPPYITTFIGAEANGTGDNAVGDWASLDMTQTATGSLRFDFAQPLTSAARILFIDIDFNEQYQIQAFQLVSGNYIQLSLTGWTHQVFSGATGLIPDASWATWNPGAGTLTGNGSRGLDSQLNVLTPNEAVDRLVITKLNGTGFIAGIQIVEVPPVPEPSTTILVAVALVGGLAIGRRSMKWASTEASPPMLGDDASAARSPRFPSAHKTPKISPDP